MLWWRKLESGQLKESGLLLVVIGSLLGDISGMGPKHEKTMSDRVILISFRTGPHT